MPDEPFFLKFLERLGINTTRLRWRLYKLGQRREQVSERGVLPSRLKWLSYPHKVCRHCGAVNDREARICIRCERSLPSMIGYRISRIAAIVMPADKPVTTTAFLMIIGLFYAGIILIDGWSAIMRPSAEVLNLFGALGHYHNPLGADWWRMLAFSFSHGGIIHIGFNCYASSQVGPIIEGQIGRKRMLALITICQLTAAMATIAWYSSSGRPWMTIGASGWLFGLIGFGVTYFHTRGQHQVRDALFRWVIYGIIFGIVIRANNAAHVGGMLGGMALGFIPDAQRLKSPWIDTAWNMACYAGLILWIVTLGYVGASIVNGIGIFGTQ